MDDGNKMLTWNVRILRRRYRPSLMVEKKGRSGWIDGGQADLESNASPSLAPQE